eukprot:SAG22_NODE_3559_length_1641_cov_1.954604_2_plen_102_part_00
MSRCCVLGETHNTGVWKIPNRHSDDGWCDYKEPRSVAGFERNRVLLYYYTGLPEDKARMMELPGAEEGWCVHTRMHARTHAWRSEHDLLPCSVARLLLHVP